ncbi:MAG: hypothetical protein FWE01_01775 [Firmicutes bacterium]|nr:hypothetical protein [Bacillota bacterium]
MNEKKEIIIDIDEIRYKQMTEERIARMEKYFANTQLNDVQGISGRPYLTEAERIQLDMVLVRAMKKYNSAMTDFIDLVDVPMPLTIDEAIIQATAEHDKSIKNATEQVDNKANRQKEREQFRLDRINKRYEEHIARINTDAMNRGMITSTIVLSQIERATEAHIKAIEAIYAEMDFIEARRTLNLERLELQSQVRINALAKRIQTENARASLQGIREKSIQRSRAFRDWIALQQTRLAVPINAQQLVDNEVHDEYLAFLMQLSIHRAIFLIDEEPLFFVNMSSSTWNRLASKMHSRSSFRHIPRIPNGPVSEPPPKPDSPIVIYGEILASAASNTSVNRITKAGNLVTVHWEFKRTGAGNIMGNLPTEFIPNNRPVVFIQNATTGERVFMYINDDGTNNGRLRTVAQIPASDDVWVANFVFLQSRD